MINKNGYLIGFCCFLCACTALTNSAKQNDLFTKIEPLNPLCQRAMLIANITDTAYANIEQNNSLTNTAMVHICVADTVYKSSDTELSAIITDGYTYKTLLSFYKMCNETIDSIGTQLSLLFEYSDKLQQLDKYATGTLMQCQNNK